ncbi:MAG TPA: ATP-binding protein [Dehalococcoidia bacterium]|nr:ATP-binding protein [Dehalococcoidia bacterium]
MNPSKAGALQQDVTRILQSLDLPDALDNQTPSLVLASGLPGSGKSTFCRRLAAETGAIVLESDALRRLLFAQPTHETRESARLFAALWEAARTLLQRNVSVIIDATNLKQTDRRPAYEVAGKTGARLLLLRFEAPESVIERRLAQRALTPEAAGNSTAGIAVYRRMAETAEPLREAHWTIDTSDFEATESALSAMVAALCSGRTRPETEISTRDLVGVAGRRNGATRRGGPVS